MPKTLYLGLDASRFPVVGEIVHIPLIQIVARPFAGEIEEAFAAFSQYTHLLFTSRTAVDLSFTYSRQAGYTTREWRDKSCLTIGSSTSSRLAAEGVEAQHRAEEETGEGVRALLASLAFLPKDCLLFPRSAQGRSLLPSYLTQRGLSHRVLDLYDTLPLTPSLPPLEEFTTIVFTSPSVVHAFFAKVESTSIRYTQCYPIGPVTKNALETYFSINE